MNITTYLLFDKITVKSLQPGLSPVCGINVISEKYVVIDPFGLGSQDH